MVQPRRRGGRRVITLSDEDEESSTAQNEDYGDGHILGAPLSRKAQTTLVSSKSKSATPTPQSTPRKPKRAAAAQKLPSPDQSKTRTLYSFFSASTQRPLQTSTSPEKAEIEPIEQKEEEDVIQDGISDNDDNIEIRTNHETTTVLPQKRSLDGLDPHGLIYGSQKYLKRSDGIKQSTAPAVIDADPRPWNEKYGPTELNELVVHKKKVADVRHWLDRSLNGHTRSRLLVLKGAAGSGKTATVSMLSMTLNFEIVEWRNPMSSDRTAESNLSLSAQFEDFLGRGSRFAGLEIVSAPGVEHETDFIQEKRELPNGRQVLLIEEFPNNLTRATAALHAFRSAIFQFLEANTQRTAPLVMIISEALISDSNSSVDNFTAHRLLGPEILHHPCADMIEFNRVAPTFIARALSLALQKRRRHTKQAYEPSADALRKLSEFGDVRNAVSTLEFLCTQKSDEIGARHPIATKIKPRPTKNKGTAQTPARSTASDEELSIISLRESSIGLFHAVGRVLYNKRTASPNYTVSSDASSSTYIPDHLSHLTRTLPSEVDLDSLIDETGTDSSTFLSSLHENYILSCFSPDGNPETTLEYAMNCLDVLADADLLVSSYSNAPNINPVASGLRQSELSFQVGVRGLLFNLPYPVKRQAPPGRAKPDAYRMFYPSGLKLWKKREEAQGLIDFFVQKAQSSTLKSYSSPSRKGANVGKSIPPPSMVSFQMSELDVSGGAQKADSTANNIRQLADEKPQTREPRVIVGSGQSARHEMLLERLPYMRRIFLQDHGMIGSTLLRQMDQITQFTGVGLLQEEEDEDVDAADVPALKESSMQSQNTGEGRRQSSVFDSNKSGRIGGPEDLTAVEKLVLSDDDIEDD